MVVWLNQLQAAFGISFLWTICLVYFIQGFKSFVWTAVSYQLKDRLNLLPSASQLVASFAGDLQSMSWFAMAFGGFCGSLIGGFAITNLQMETNFSSFSVLPAMQLLSCGLDEEDSFGVKDRNGSISYSDVLSVRSCTTRRTRSCKNREKQKFIRTRSETLQMMARPMTWFFLAHVTVPNLSTIMLYHMTEVLHLDASFLGTSCVVGWLVFMIGTFIFNRFLKCMKLRRILMFAQVGLAILSLFDIALINLWLCGSVLADAVFQFKLMPFLVLSGQLCPPGIEGTLFAHFMSINNLGTTLGSFVGAGLASMLNISSSSFDNLLLGIFIQVFCIFIPIGFLFLIPKEATGTTA
ncbi:hypothetical protein NE237_016362 [Protea cynaroides]|uniref:Uncharacterized protein n=1 Tax=Protea cynaroides TaxID=273540 RepID=A0A9Q0GL40_9MAGN|nr:hypothetical protein NE237_016362 [Protea cynaroides]